MNIVIDSTSLYGVPLRRDRELLVKLAVKLTNVDGYNITVLDRGNISLSIGAFFLPFPRYSPNRFNAEDSVLIQKICDYIGADLFLSEISTPLTTPTVLVVAESDQGKELRGRSLMELDLAKAFCDAIVCDEAEGNGRVPELYESGHSEVIFGVENFCDFILKKNKENSRERAVHFDHLPCSEWARLRALQAKVDVIVWDDEED